MFLFYLRTRARRQVLQDPLSPASAGMRQEL